MRVYPLVSWCLVLVCASGASATSALAADDQGHERIEEFLKRVEKTTEAVAKAQESLEETLVDYTKMLSAETHNRRKLYDNAWKGIERTEERSKELGDRLREMYQESGVLFKGWKKSLQEIREEKLRARSDKRLTAASERHDKLHGRGLDARSELDSVVSVLRDHMLYLEHDLNDSSVKSLAPEAAELAGRAKKCVAGLQDYSKSAVEFAKSLSPE
jgi:DNA repair exonuclease SbcCD ATPase subunit